MPSRKSNVLLIYTGGTIGMITDKDSGALHNFQLDQLMHYIPEMKQVNCTMDSYTFSPPIDSSDMEPKIWGRLAKIIAENYDKHDGFVILHGTDTMAYTASALSFMLSNLNKPVILTGSQLPIGALRTDGKENLLTSIEIAATKINGHAVVPEVCILFEHKLLRGNRTIKLQAENFNAFRSYNHPRLADCGININYYSENILPYKSGQTLIPQTKMCRDVVILKLFTGIQENVVNAILNIPHLKGVVLESFGSGNAPQKAWLIEAMRKATLKGIVIINISQCLQGSVQMERYATGLHLSQAGVISGNDMTTESAITKLMFLFGLGMHTDEVRIKMVESLAGEISC